MKYVQSFVKFTKQKSLPGFKGVPIYSVLKFVIGEATKYDISTRANSIAYSFFLAIFPSIIFLFTLIPLLPIDFDFLNAFSESTKDILPAEAHKYIFSVVNDVVNINRTGLRSIGFFLAVFFASSGMLTLMTGFDKSYSVFNQRSFLHKRLVALYLTFLLTLLLVISLVLIVFGSQIVQYGMSYILEDIANVTLYLLRIVMTFLVLYTGFTIIYRIGPSLKDKTEYINTGAIVATLLSILTSLVFAYFVNKFGRYNELYGSIGALIVVMIWLQLNAFILIIGFELNVSIAMGLLDNVEESDHSNAS